MVSHNRLLALRLICSRGVTQPFAGTQANMQLWCPTTGRWHSGKYVVVVPHNWLLALRLICSRGVTQPVAGTQANM